MLRRRRTRRHQRRAPGGQQEGPPHGRHAEACQAGFCAGLGTAAAIAEVLGTHDLSDMQAAAQATLVDTIDAAVREVMEGGDAR